MTFNPDLHCHSTFSDGYCTPKEIIEIAVEQKLSGISITDHDSIAAYPEVLNVAKSYNIPIISGVELSSIYKNERIHMLGYSFSLENSIISDICNKHLQARWKRNDQILKQLNKHGIKISMEEMSNAKQGNIIGRVHIANAMIKKGYVNNIQEAFDKYLGDDKEFGLMGDFSSTKEAIDAIHKANGKAVLAHPGSIKNQFVLNELFQMDIDGIECYHGFFSHDKKRFIDLANSRGLLITGGSDFHGACKPNISLGSSWTPKASFQYLLKHFESNL